MHLAACSPALAHFPPSLTAAALVVHLRQRACSSPLWPSALATMTGLADPGVPPLAEAVAAVEVLLQGVAAQQQAARARQHQQQQQLAAAAAVAAMQEAAAGLGAAQHGGAAPGGGRSLTLPLTIGSAANNGAGSSRGGASWYSSFGPGGGASSSAGAAGAGSSLFQGAGSASSGMLAAGSLDQGLLAGSSAGPQVGLEAGSAGSAGLLQAASADSLLGGYLAQSLAVGPGLNYMLSQQALGDQMKQLEEAMGRRLL